MSDYLQPDFYRFTQDSIDLVKWISNQKKSASSILDLGAGCGVMGIELARNIKPSTLTLVEAQADYLSYLQNNTRLFVEESINVKIFISTFALWQSQDKFDLIVCNPPYYLPGHGRDSKDKRRGMARTFIMDGWTELFECIQRSLAPLGKAYVVIKNEKILLEVVKKSVKQTNLAMDLHPSSFIVFLELSTLNENGHHDSF